MKDHYQKAADEIIKGVNTALDFVVAMNGRDGIVSEINMRQAKKQIIELLKANFNPKKSKFN
jgi:hypothetical protein